MIAQLLHAYSIPCVIVLDRDAQRTADDLGRLATASLSNIKAVFRLQKGNIEDYFPLEIVAEVINRQLSPTTSIAATDFDDSKSGRERLEDFKSVMRTRGAGDSIRYLKRQLGGLGARLMKERGILLDPELVAIFEAVKTIADQA